MRTTVSLDDGLLKTVKRLAASSGMSVSQYIETALREAVSRPKAAPEEKPFQLITFGEGGLQPGVTWERIKEVIDEEDCAPFRQGGGGAAP